MWKMIIYHYLPSSRCCTNLHSWKWHVLQPPTPTHQHNHKNPTSNHVDSPRISSFMNLQLYTIFSSLLSTYVKIIIRWTYKFIWDGFWIRFLYLSEETSKLVLVLLHSMTCILSLEKLVEGSGMSSMLILRCPSSSSKSIINGRSDGGNSISWSLRTTSSMDGLSGPQVLAHQSASSTRRTSSSLS